MTAQRIEQFVAGAEQSEHDAESVTSGAIRMCKLCSRPKPVTPSEWVFSKGLPRGAVCRACSRQRKKDFDTGYKKQRVEARNAGLATLAPVPSAPAVQVATRPSARDAAPGELSLKQIDVARALRVGAAALNAEAEAIIAILVGYAKSPESAHHEWALKLLAERALPAKMFAEIGMAAAGVGGKDKDAKPSVTINVVAATPTAAPVVVVEERSE